MRFRLVLTALILFIFAASGLHAGGKNSRLFYFRTEVTMNGAEIPAGIYEVSWESEKNMVRVTLWKDGRFVATAKGEWAKHGVKYTDNATLLRVNTDGSRSLVEIRLAGVKKTIVLSTVDSPVQVGSK